MLGVLLRFWLVITILWWGYNLYIHRDKLGTLKERDWMQALEYGVNNIFCEIKIFGNCKAISVPFFQRSQVNETFGLIVSFIGYPMLALIACLILAWILHKPKKA
jgi:hypothetical protein